MIRLKFTRRACLAAVLLLFSPTMTFAQSPMIYNRGNSGEPDTLDPQKASGAWEANIIRDLFLGLTVNDARGETVPGAAERWDVSEDGRVYRFYMRPNLYWSDGQPVTADDFVFSFQRLVDPKTAAGYASNLFVVENGEAINAGKLPKEKLAVRALDEQTLEIRLHSPVPYFLQMLTHVASFAVPKHVVESRGAAWVRPGTMVSNGAYVLSEWRPHDRIVLKKNEKFYEAENVAIDQINYFPTEDEQTALKQFRAGEVDSSDGFPARQYAWLKANMPQQLRISPWLGLYYYAFNSEHPPFNDVRVRQALSMAIPREEITDKLLGYGVLPAYSIVPPGIGNYGKGAVARFKTLSREERYETARKLLKEAGYGADNPLKVTISYNSNKDHKKIALAVAYGWKQIGVRATLFNVEARVHFNNLKVADFEVARAGWVADYNDPENFLFLLNSKTGQLNYGQYSNPEYDRLMVEAARTLDLEQRAEILTRAEEISLQDMPIAPIYFYVSRSMVQTWLKGWEDNIMDIHPSRYMRIEGRKSSR